MVDELKTFILAAAVIVGTFALVVMSILPPDGWWQGCTVGIGAYTARTIAKKITDKKNGV